MPKRFTITAALPYANGPIHIGHLAGVYIPADTYARYLRLKNRDVAFICGSDEHGVAIDIKAKNEGKTPKQIIDYYDQIIVYDGNLNNLERYFYKFETLNPSFYRNLKICKAAYLLLLLKFLPPHQNQ